MPKLALIVAVMLSFSSFSAAQDKDEIAKQKAAIDDAVKKLKLKTSQIIETADLIICTTMSEAKAKTLAETAQKAVAVARENLKYEKDAAIFPTKLAVYAFTDFTDLKAFIRQIEQRRPGDEPYVMAVRTSPPYVAISPEIGAKLVEADVITTAAGWAAAAILAKKTGGPEKLPDWLLQGYGRACWLRSEPASRQSTYRLKVKSVVSGKGKAVVWAKDIWSGDKLIERDLVTGSFVEYLAFGPYAEKFPSFASQMKPNLINENPMVDGALLATIEANVEATDYAWKQWVIKGK